MSTARNDDRTDRIYIQTIHFEVTEAIRLAVAEKFRGLMSRSAEIVRLNVRLAQDQRLGDALRFSGTAQLEIRGPDLIAQAEGTDVYGIMDALVEKLEVLLDRRQGKRKDKRNHPHGIELDAELPKVGDVAGEVTGE